MNKNRNIKRIFQMTVFTLFAFFIFGAINVNAETVTVYDKDTFTNEFKNKTNTSDVIQLAADIDMSDVNYEQVLSIYKDKTIDLKGNTLILPDMQLSIQYNANATVKFIDSSSGKTGKILGADDSTGDYPLITVFTDASSLPEETYLVFDGVKIERKNDVYGYVIGNGTNGTKLKKVSFINTDITNFYSLNDSREAKNFYYENITFRRGVSGRGYLINSSDISVSDVISEDSEIIEEYSNGSLKQEFSNDTKMNEVYTGGNVLKVIYKDGFTVSNVNLKEKLGYTNATEKEISITNSGQNDLSITNVSVNSSDFKVSGPETETTLAKGETNTSWKIKAKDELEVGIYNATITVTASNGKTYTSTVTLEVEEYDSEGNKVTIVTTISEFKKAIDENVKIIKLANNLTFNDRLGKLIDNDITIDLNGKTISTKTGNFDFIYTDAATIQIIDSSKAKTGKIEDIGAGASGAYAGIIQLTNNNEDSTKECNLIIDGIKMIGKNRDASMIVVGGNSDIKNVILKDSTFNNYQYIIDDRNIKKITMENIKTTAAEAGRAYLVDSNSLKISEVIADNSEVVLLNADGSYIRTLPSDETVKYSFVTNGQSIAVRYLTGFNVSNVTLNETYGYINPVEKEISIKNRGTSDLTIKNVSINSENFELSGPTTDINLPAGETNTSWKIKARTGLSAGNYTADITVTDMENNATYTGTVTLKVLPKELTDLGIGGVNGTIEYGTDYTPTLTGTTELGTTDYEVKYAEKTGEDTYGEESSSKPKNVGDYKVTIKVTNSNYNAPEISTFYSITPKTIEPTISVDDQEYTGNEIIPPVNVFNKSTKLDINDDYTIEFADNINAGDAEVIIRPVAGSNYTFTNPTKKTFKIYGKPLTNSSISITLTQTSFGYTGSDISPEPVVKDGEKTLVLDTDYTLSYSNNKNTGNNSAVVKVIGKGNYRGEVTKNFSIVEKTPQVINFTETSVAKTYGDYDFKIEANHPEGNGTIKYTSSNTDVAEVNATTGLVTIKNAGTATITATASATDDYAEEKATYTLTVEKKEISIDRAVANGKEYDGTKTAEVDYVVFDGLVYGDTLEKDVDYTATAEFDSESMGYNKPVNVKVVLKATAANNYKLTNAEYQTRANISGKAISTDDVDVDTTTTYTYDGTQKKAKVTVEVAGTKLTEGTDYTVTYGKNINAGTGTLTVKGIGNYSGEVAKEFTIEKKSITLTISDISDVTYNGSKYTPEPVVKDGETQLRKNIDYTLSYDENTNAGKGKIFISSVASSNYTFGHTTKTFNINKYSIQNSDITLEYETVLYDGTDKEPNVTVKLGNITIPASEYDVTYSADHKSVGTASATVTIKSTSTNFKGSATKTFEIVDKTPLTITGISNQEVVYTGSPVELVGTLQVSNGINPSSLTEKWYKGSTEISKPKNVGVYKVVYSYEDDTYKGSLTVNVTITKKESTLPTLNSYTAVAGDKLSSITLPTGFNWSNSNEEIIAGNKEYTATYTTNNDSTNYTTKTIQITVYGKSKVNLNTSVNGLGGTISSSKTNILEGTTETIIFTPNEGYEISKVEVNGIDKTSSIINNKLNLVIESSDVTVIVTYKVIQYTITINGVENVTINPTGIIKVDYNTNKTITIMAELGYNLVSVKVNGVERINDLVNDELTLENILADTEIVVVVERNMYEVVEGANQKYIITKNNEAKFKMNAEYIKFERGGSVYVDDELVDPSNYTSESGSTIITLKKEFVDSLSEGVHTLKVLFTDGEATTTFTVAKLAGEENPNTGDNIIFYIVTGIISTLGLVGTTVYFYKRKQTN